MAQAQPSTSILAQTVAPIQNHLCVLTLSSFLVIFLQLLPRPTLPRIRAHSDPELSPQKDKGQAPGGSSLLSPAPTRVPVLPHTPPGSCPLCWYLWLSSQSACSQLGLPPRSRAISPPYRCLLTPLGLPEGPAIGATSPAESMAGHKGGGCHQAVRILPRKW